MSDPLIHGGGVLGEKITEARRQLDTFDLPENMSTVVYASDEVTSLCPITGQPDWYKVRIEISGSKLGIESKSLKLYLQSFRNDGQFCEVFSSEICRDVSEATNADSVHVTVTQKPRGGVAIQASAYEFSDRMLEVGADIGDDGGPDLEDGTDDPEV